MSILKVVVGLFCGSNCLDNGVHLTVQICDTTPKPTHRNPSNHIPAHNADGVTVTPFFTVYNGLTLCRSLCCPSAAC